MNRALILIFGAVAYGVFFVTFLYLVAFVGNLQQTRLAEWLPVLPSLVPYSIDAGRGTGNVALAFAIDLGLVALFGLQHSAMARMGFKAWLKQRLPAAAERSVYVFVASVALIFLFWQWRPIPTPLWTMTSTAGQWAGWLIFGAGFAIVLLSTFLIDHFDLFGLKQTWRHFTSRASAAPRFVTPLFYRLVRHPLYLGFILAFWGGPTVTTGHLLFAAAMTTYILFAIRLEERDLLHHLGDDYARYRARVPMLIPGWRAGRAGVEAL